MDTSTGQLILDYVYQHEENQPDKVFLSQPVGNGAVVHYTWRETLDQARRMAAYLRSQGVQSPTQVAILSKNCAHFFIAELAIWLAGGTTVAIFPTENAETIRFVLEQSEAKLLFVGKLDNWHDQASAVPAGMPTIHLPLAVAPSGNARGWDDVVAQTAPLPGRPVRGADELAMINYTSGSTGVQKGVMHCFGHVTRATESIIAATGMLATDRCISYLPLAHIFERAYIESTGWICGQHIYFAESLDTFIADLQRAKPTVFVSVPRLWLKFQLGVFEKMPERKLDILLRIPLVGWLVRRKILAGLGLDHVRVAGSGSAPIPPELITWYRRIGLNLVEGYAMTEDFACSHISTATHNKPGYVGVPLPGVEARISPDDEILIKSPGQFVGYFKRPELDAECFTADGFFRTGDRGSRDPDGMLKITGRVKELFKTAKGKYVAPAPIENLLNAHGMVELSMVSGVGQRAAYGLVLLSEAARKLAATPAGRISIEGELTSLLHAVNAQLVEYEQLQMLVLVSSPWTIENGMLTPTMKIKRTVIENAVASRLDAWYGAEREIVWE